MLSVVEYLGWKLNRRRWRVRVLESGQYATTGVIPVSPYPVELQRPMVATDHLAQLISDCDGLASSHSQPLDLGLEAGIFAVCTAPSTDQTMPPLTPGSIATMRWATGKYLDVH